MMKRIIAFLALAFLSVTAQAQYLGADLDEVGTFSDQSAESFLRFLEIPSSPATADMVLDNIQIRLPAGATADVALYSGGTTTSSTGMTLIFSGQAVNAGGASAVITVTAGGQPIPASTRLWLAHKGAGQNITIGTVGDGVMDDITTIADMWGPDQTPSNMATLGEPWPTVVPAFQSTGGTTGMPIMGLNYSIDSGGGGLTNIRTLHDLAKAFGPHKSQQLGGILEGH